MLAQTDGLADGQAFLKDTQSLSRRRSSALDQFLAGVELKAYRMAMASLRHEEDALDVVQDAMLQLARAYADRPEVEWKALFYRILQNRVRDMQRRRMVRSKVMALLPWRRDEEAEETPDPIAQSPSLELQPPAQLEVGEAMAALDEALAVLSARQREAFMLRALEGMDVAQTAQVMGCSEGSVKTHYFRALQILRQRLGDFAP